MIVRVDRMAVNRAPACLLSRLGPLSGPLSGFLELGSLQLGCRRRPCAQPPPETERTRRVPRARGERIGRTPRARRRAGLAAAGRPVGIAPAAVARRPVADAGHAAQQRPRAARDAGRARAGAPQRRRRIRAGSEGAAVGRCVHRAVGRAARVRRPRRPHRRARHRDGDARDARRRRRGLPGLPPGQPAAGGQLPRRRALPGCLHLLGQGDAGDPARHRGLAAPGHRDAAAPDPLRHGRPARAASPARHRPASGLGGRRRGDRRRHAVLRRAGDPRRRTELVDAIRWLARDVSIELGAPAPGAPRD
jgi:hypothetical protein